MKHATLIVIAAALAAPAWPAEREIELPPIPDISEAAPMEGPATTFLKAPALASAALPVEGVAKPVAPSEQELRALIGDHRGFIPAEKFQKLMAKAGLERDALLKALLPIAKDMARPEVSRYPVGAVGLGESGNVYLGGNLSFIGVPISLSSHAEQAVAANARKRGEKILAALAVTDEPCGGCRQFLREVDPALQMRVLIPEKEHAPMEALLPRAFVRGRPSGAPAPLLGGLTAPPASARVGVPKDLLDAALAGANASNSPKAPSGAALRMKDGTVYSDSYFEVHGGYMSLPPLLAALGQLVREGRPYADIAEVVLVELKEDVARVVQRDSARLLLRKIAPGARLRVVEAQRP